MVHRIAIVAGIAGAAVVLVISIAAASFNANGGGTGAGAAALPAAADVLPAPLEKTVTDTVYVKPVPSPKVIHVTKPASGPASTPKPLVIVKHVASHNSGDDGGSGDGGREAGGD